MAEGHCEVCGGYSSSISVYVIEGTPMSVCPDCGTFGRKEKSNAQLRAIYAKINSKEFKTRIKVFNQEYAKRKEGRFSTESGERVVDDYSLIIREIVNHEKLTNEEFAKKINEKESYISQILSGHIRPSIEFAKRLEKLYKVKLVEAFDESSFGTSAMVRRGESSSDNLTIGDMIKQSLEKNKKK
ncbi:MAG: multiprotein-bridging factor 1 family protein [Candidatus Woesearchaeota archaeon]|jgi:putative transcription factor